METKLRVLLVGFIFMLMTSSAQADEAVSLKVGYLLLSPSGDIAVSSNGFGTKIDLENDLDLGDSSNVMAEAAFAIGDVKLSLGYLPLAFEGDSILTKSILYNGQFYSVGRSIESTLDLNILDVGMTWYIVNIDDLPTRFQFGIELAAKVTDAETSLTDKLSGISESASETLPIPTLGLRARVAFSDFVGISGRVGYIEYSDNHFLDADIQIEISPIPMVGIFAGYRYMDVAIDESDVFVDTTLSGFYGGALVRF